MAAFEELGVCPEIIRACEDEHWHFPSPVQQEAIPLILGGGDVMAAAETGSGKTGAFGLPIGQIVSEALQEELSGRAPVVAAAAGKDDGVKMNVDDKDAMFSISPDGLQVTVPAPVAVAG